MKKDGIVAIRSRSALATVLLAVAGLALACGSSYPSESEGRKGLEQDQAKYQYFRVRSFTKTNGMGDDKHYTMEFDTELECLQPIPARCGKGQTLKKSGKIEFEKTENGWRAVSVSGV